MRYGIVRYGCYIPRLRTRGEEYSKAWSGSRPSAPERAVADIDEDVLTMAFESSKHALNGLGASDIDVLCLASTSLPYAFRVNSGTLASSLGLKKNIVSGEFAQSTRSGTEAFIMALSLLKAWDLSMALVAAADFPLAKAIDELESEFGAASVSYVLGKEPLLARLDGFGSSIDEHLSAEFRSYGDPDVKELGLTSHMRQSAEALLIRTVSQTLQKLGRAPSDYSYVVSSEDYRAPSALAKLGFSSKQMEPVLLRSRIGNAGASSTLLGLAAALDVSQPDELILVVSFGPGAACDVLSLTYEGNGKSTKCGIEAQLMGGEYIDYMTHIKIRKNLR